MNRVELLFFVGRKVDVPLASAVATPYQCGPTPAFTEAAKLVVASAVYAYVGANPVPDAVFVPVVLV